MIRRVNRALQDLQVHGFAPNATPCTSLLFYSDGRTVINNSARKFLATSGEIALRLANCKPPQLSGRMWTEAENVQLAQGLPVPGRSYHAIDFHRRILQCTSNSVAFSKAVYNSLGSPQALQYESWLPIARAQHLPANAEISWKQGVARIPKAWHLSLPSASFALSQSAKQLPTGAELVLKNVTAETKVSTILEEVHAFLKGHLKEDTPSLESMAIAVESIEPSMDPSETSALLQGPENLCLACDCECGEPTHATLAAHDAAALLSPPQPSDHPAPMAPPILLPAEATARDADLFNRQTRLTITVYDGDNQSYNSRRREVQDPAHNPRPKAPEHIGMANNISDATHRHCRKTHLSKEVMGGRRKRALSAHIQRLGSPLERCCFQCGMLNYPKDGDRITVKNISGKRDCRAYRVFRYYIKKRATSLRDQLQAQGEDIELAEAEAQIFLCEPHEEGGCDVWTCNACKTLCRRRKENRVVYKQCSAARLDLFDGHDCEGNYESIGIGDKQPKAYADLSVHDRLALSVLKVCEIQTLSIIAHINPTSLHSLSLALH